MGKSARAMGKRRDMGALMGLVRVPPGCSRSASSMRKASKAQAENVAVVATCTAIHLHGRMLQLHTRAVRPCILLGLLIMLAIGHS